MRAGTLYLKTSYLMRLIRGHNRRFNPAPVDMAALTEEIRKDGIKQPVMITVYLDGDRLCNDGHRRIRIAEKLGIEFVPVTLQIQTPKIEDIRI